MDAWGIGVAGGLTGGLAVLAIGLATPRRKCPDCGDMLPRMRKPANERQALSGGTTCAKCGCESDRNGVKINESSAASTIEPPSMVARKRSLPKLSAWTFVWTLTFWLTPMVLIGAVAGTLDPQHGAQAGARAGEALGGLSLLLSIGLSVALTVSGMLPGTRKSQVR